MDERFESTFDNTFIEGVPLRQYINDKYVSKESIKSALEEMKALSKHFEDKDNEMNKNGYSSASYLDKSIGVDLSINILKKKLEEGNNG